tara:strand:+ start:40 stop:354 length:315 start_codon:yes stop_codon:yes gene_type:complete
MGLLIPVAIYAYAAYTLQTIAKKTNTKDEWLAWIPIVNLYLMCRIAKKPGWWVILLLIPLVNIVFTVIIWWEIAKVRNKPRWLGILMIVPLFNLIVFGILAFSD